jgi:FAD/FMN-containing dehydrogenase
VAPQHPLKEGEMAVQVESLETDEFVGFRGELITRGHPDYEQQRRVWNAMIDRQPLVIACCTGAADVISALSVARQRGLPVAVRGGAHNVAGRATCDDGIVIDLSSMKGIRVDRSAHTVRAEPGLRWSEFDRETQAFGLATTGGTVGDTGIAGLTLGGGFGWLAGKYGMTVDNLLAADVVTATGELVVASSEEHPDLFWALRGGSGNFGVVTSFEYRLHEVGPLITGGAVFHPFPSALDVLRFYRNFVSEMPDDVTAYAVLLTTPGGPVAAIAAAHCGALEDGERELAPLKEFGSPVQDLIGPIPYVAQQALLDDAMPPGLHNYWKSEFVASLDDALLETLVERYASVPSPRSAIFFGPINGAANRVAPDATAYPHRSGVLVGVYSLWEEPAQTERNIAWTRETWATLQAFGSGGVYVNELGEDEGEDRVRQAFGPNYDRLAQIKATYDPTNLFRLNANVQPSEQARQ